MIDSPLVIVMGLLAGFALGGFFFGGLWLTVKNIHKVKNPALLFFSSMIIRLAIILTGFYFIGDHDWQRILLLLIGFITARFFVIKITKTPRIKSSLIPKKSNNEA